MWKADCTSGCIPCPTGHARRTRQPPSRQPRPRIPSSHPWHAGTSYPSAPNAPTGQAARQGAAHPSHGRAAGGGSSSRSASASAPRYETISPRRACTRRPTGDAQASPLARAQPVNGRHGGPPNGNSASPPHAAASPPITRSDQRSSGSAPAVAKLGAGRENLPEPRPGRPEQHQRPAAARRPVPRPRVQRAQHLQPDGPRLGRDAREPGQGVSRGSACRRRAR